MPDVNLSPELLKNLAASATALAAVVGAFIAILQYFKLTTHREKVAAVRKSFEGVVASLASENEVDRLAGAILLRRFFDPTTEVTTKDTPYAAETINVIAAILRGQPSGNFQKLLADGLAFAPSLQRADLQRTNLHNAYLGSRGQQQVDLSYADFYRADLSGASFKGANASGAFFYQTRMTDAVLRNTDLRGANFFEADLYGVNFDGAKLAGATFEGARNVPSDLKPHLEGHCWNGPEVFKVSARVVRAETPVIYVSKPGCLDERQEKIVGLVCGWIYASGLRTEVLERVDYPATGALGEVRRRMSGCKGAAVFGFGEFKISEGLWRPGTADEAKVRDQASSTPWCELEAGMAVMVDLPLLLVADPALTKGVFDPLLVEHNIFRLIVPPDRLSPGFRNWLVAVGERARLVLE
jgi:uncharacterized protein YjbI with pentapeptide repeats